MGPDAFFGGFEGAWKLYGPLGIVGFVIGAYLGLPDSGFITQAGTAFPSCNGSVGPCDGVDLIPSLLLGVAGGAVGGGVASGLIAMFPGLKETLGPPED